MTRKTESLSYPTNPLAAIRELQELDAKPVALNGSDPVHKPHQVALPTSSVVASAHSSEEASADSSDVGSAPRHRRPKPPPAGKADSSRPEPPDDPNPLANAVRDMLSQPYMADPRKGPFTVSTVKIPTEVSERLGWVAAFTGKTKQEILSEALKDYFQKILKGQ
jgi:hypothetical protein